MKPGDPQVMEALKRIQEIADVQLPALELPERQLDVAALPRFSNDLPAELDPDAALQLREDIDRLSPWLQGPFYLGGDVVIDGVWRKDQLWQALEGLVPDVRGKRVLDVGSNAGYDAFMFHQRGASEVIACEPFEFIEQARFLESIYRTGIRFEQVGWQRLDPERHGTFDLVHCNGILYHEPNPIETLKRLRRMVSDGGQLLLGSMMLDDAEVSEYARFVRTTYAEDPTWWWVPGRLALRWMMDACGFDVELLPVRFNGPRGDFPVINGYLRGYPTEPDPQLPSAGSTRAEAVNRFPLGHYYSPMYDTQELQARREQLWPPKARDTVGVDWREDAQLELCRTVFAVQQELPFVDQPSDDPTEYYALNDQYPPDDAWVLAGVLEHFRPARMIEVGCGFSTLVSARVNREKLGMGMRLECIEPYPRQFLVDGVPGVSELRIEKIQDTPLELFEELSAGDVLFVDTAHTVKTGGDVVWIFDEIIPRLAPGVLVHVHDVFLPGEYPQQWVMEGWGWNETYLVRAFLAFNEAFDVVWGQQFMLQRHLEEVFLAFPGLRRYGPSGAALWIRRH